MDNSPITLKDLAPELHIDRSRLRKFALELGVEMLRVRPPGTKGTPLLAVTPADAERIRKERAARGFQVGGDAAASGAPRPVESDSLGAFYVIALDPAARPGRLKFGYAQNVMQRLSTHRTSAPEAVLLKSWPAQRSWEPCIMAALSVGCTNVAGEVYDAPDADEVVARADRFMAMLPSSGDTLEEQPNAATPRRA
jgi:hypothetical protein